MFNSAVKSVDISKFLEKREFPSVFSDIDDTSSLPSKGKSVSFLNESKSTVEVKNASFFKEKSEFMDEFADDDDPGYDMYECDKTGLEDASRKIAEQNNFPQRASYVSKFKFNEKSAFLS